MAKEKQLTGCWSEDRRFVFNELNRLERIEEKVNAMYAEIAVLKYKSGLWGAVGGAIPVLVVLAIFIVRGFLSK